MSDAPAAYRLPTGPTGLGSSASGLALLGTAAGPSTAASAPAPAASPRSRLHCPPAVRHDPALEREVNEELVAWAERTGINPGGTDALRAMDFGRLITLAYPHTEDPDRLLAIAKPHLSLWIADDCYVDESSLGAVPVLLGARLGLAHAAIDPVPLPARYAPELARELDADPVLRAHQSAWRHLRRYATPVQVQRVHHAVASLFVGCGQEATWHEAERLPPAWEYLTSRCLDNFRLSMLMIDTAGGYEVPAQEYADPRVRRVLTLAATAGQLVNDVYSVAKDAAGPGLSMNLPAVIAAEEGCAVGEAVERTVDMHNELMHTYEAEAAALALTGSPLLRCWLAQIRDWLGGAYEWHATSARYGGPA
ncbi:family 2 encapsulin nanocompartment cargo protein terpene cyclase [Streptomyces sp. NPDC087440]|uniref:family 2 encapsulin nanocompartment cargo protein terpene cyclase n=1 Tax=Streptomyces sp. NPDC087440 TaxID=3365790 RepID=UPI00382DEDED